MRTYSNFFQTLHDETGPVGSLGRGTHYSVLRAVVFHDPEGEVLDEAHHLDFAIVWDEDHDERQLEPIFKLYCAGLLPSFTMFGERKGALTAIASPQLIKSPSYCSFLTEELQKACDKMANGDWWSTEIGWLNDPHGIVNDEEADVSLYLRTLNMLWGLGLKKIVHPISDAEREAEQQRFMDKILKQSKAG